MSNSAPGSESGLAKVATPSPSPLAKLDADFTSSKFEMHPSLSDEERRFYLKMYPNVDLVNQRKVHCTVCKLHLGTAPAAESNIKMHPILRVTHCVKCHDFYNSGEFSKGEDGSELYCRWCGQGGEVYCCSTCPYVFCKSCIVKNLSKGVIVDIEQNENWNCFSCTSKILWPLRAQHWALVNYLQTQKRALQTLQLPEVEARRQMLKDNSNCCRLAKSKTSSLSDSMESLESNVSKRSQGSSAGSSKRGSMPKTIPPGPPSKRAKASNNEVVCTPDLLSMLEPDCQLSVTPKPTGRQTVTAANITTPRIVTVQQNYQPGQSSSNSGSNGSTNQQQRAPQVRVGNANPAPPPLQGLPPNANGGQTLMITPAPQPAPKVPTLVRLTFPNTPMGQARAQLQEQIFSAMDICTHLTGKVVSLTHSNAYNQVRSYLELKELYIHMSYLMTYAIGRFKNLQEKCLVDMREKGFKNDANSLENGQLAAAVDYVCYGQLDDVDLFNTGCNSFHNQVYEYRKSLHANLKDGEDCEPLPPLMPLGVRAEGDPIDEPEEPETVPEPQQDDTEKDHEDAAEFDYDEPEDLDDDLDDDDLDNEECGELGTEESMNRNEQAHAYDRKLTRLLREYPSLWCTRHPDYGKKEVTNKQWRVIASHFPRGDDIKLRWKNVRKRYVRIERRLKQGKRFKGYFDKATNYLENRDRPRSEWLAVDCGEDDGDGFERKHLDVIENKMEQKAHKQPAVKINLKGGSRIPTRPLEVRPIDQRIITFAKSHPVLWRKSADPEFNSIDEQTRKSLWQNFWKSAPNYACEYLVERWQQMYEMYKSFRLKSIKDKGIFANLELKYSKYLASLYFLYKIDEQDLRDEFEPLQDCVPSGTDSAGNLKDMPDDKQFCQQLVLAMRAYPTLWNPRHVDYSDVGARERLWPEVARRLPRFKRDAQACKLRWQMAKFAYECYLREMERHPRVNERKLQKLRSNFPLEEMRFLNI
uniref:ADD domain-containing protein 1, isoform E n=1 Tax=Drosophila melanogaster TaxID=7227 RepID=A0A0B4LEU5_DROME|nr:ADD domain-containing protein 1, isoform E [Drosophila melanogaster]AHN56121.1 ADD domain-containing protein 1, isoform E [Drosophila melanogaster]|eukprot:NP_001286323.1 ADD domain-containing protein 1, isoform E [Drosophila melanogaster]